MKKRIISIIGSLTAFCLVMGVSIVNVKASDERIVDGSYLTMDETSSGHSSTKTRGQYLMTGDCSITKAGRNRVYAYASTTANHEVNYLCTIVYLDQYQEELDEWWQLDETWDVEMEHHYFLSTARTITVDRGYYYRVRADHFAGDEYPYDETTSFTNGIYIPTASE